ncbi:MAG TPA: zinc carboxypeptidase [Cytophagales bacterium]|nr:zinc carboxypeptidase [Cytophagales bacterium]
MVRYLLSLAVFCSAITCTYAQSLDDLAYFLYPNLESNDISFVEGIQTPEEFLGYRTGEWHITHDQLVSYMRYLASASDLVSLTETGSTYENRPLLLLTVASQANMGRMDEIKAEHAKLVDPEASRSLNLNDMPVVVYLGYSVHGNEASGGNAVPMLMYALAACMEPNFRAMLENMVVLVDPCLNPDGFQRFSTWTNMHKSLSAPNPDPQDREHSEVWPGGRTNHYWFDLNRDWMPAQHPESQARLKQFHDWYPNVVIDAHEMGTNGTYFFQPGIESRNNPLTPENNYVLTRKISQYHGQSMDNIGSLYYTREGYDDYYLGKGATYPDLNGGVAILFEQGSARGHAQDSENGVLTFPFAIRNQLTTSIGTLKAARDLRVDLLEHQRAFYTTAIQEAKSDELKAYRFGSEKDPRRAEALVNMLLRHQIEVYRTQDEKEGTFLVPLEQRQYRYIKGLFEKRTQFQDSLFYDVSTWNMLMAFNLNYDELRGRSFNKGMLGALVTDFLESKGSMNGGQSDYAYVFETHGYYAHRALYRLLKAGLRVDVSRAPFSDGENDYDYGTALVGVANQSLTSDQIYAYMQEIADEDGMNVYAQNTGYTQGVQLGSPSMAMLRKPEVAIITGQGVSPYEVGEVWHLLDQRMNMPISLLPNERFGRFDLSRYNVMVMVNGSYSFSKSQKEKLQQWVRSGGVLIGTKSAVRWLSSNDFTNVSFTTASKDDPEGRRPYEMARQYSGAQVIGGTIFEATLDRTHPLGFGFEDESIHLFRNHTTFMKLANNPYANPVVYTADPLASGYISDRNLEALGNTASVQVSSLGRGRVISLVDNPNFRAFWYGTNKLFLNSIFYGHFVSGATTE